MSASNRLVDYFVITGLDITSGLEPDQLSGDNLHCSPLDRPYKCAVLGHHPENVPWNPFDKSAVCMLCHPLGLKFKTEKESPDDASFHSFIITKEDGTRSYGAALTYYERVDNTEICTAMQTLQAMHMAELSNAQSRTLYSHLGDPVHQRSPKLAKRPGSVSCGRMYDMRHDVLYATKTMCLITPLPLITMFSQFLRTLHAAICDPETLLNQLPLDSYIYNIIYEVPLPPPGRSLKFNTVGGQTIVCQRPSMAELPLLDYSLPAMFELLGIDNVLSIFTSILLEHQMLLYSTDYERLMCVAEGITALVFPFQWQHVYVPILPASLIHFLDAPVPFIMGLHHTKDDSALQKIASVANMCFVNIDRGTVELPEDLPVFPYRNELKEDILSRFRSRPQSIVLEDEQYNGNHAGGGMVGLGGGGGGGGGAHHHHHAANRHHVQHRAGNGNYQRDSGFRESFMSYDEAAMSSNEISASSSTWSIPNKMEILQQNEALARITALAKRTGVIQSLEDITTEQSQAQTAEQKQPPPSTDPNVQNLMANSSFREVFLHYFLQMFSSYEAFVIQPPSTDMETWLSNRESMQNFDKAAYLCDQPEAHLPFLSAFIETQMFTTLIDNKVLSQWEEPETCLRVFELRLRTFRDEHRDQRLYRYNRNSIAIEAEGLIEKRGTLVDLVAPTPHPLEGLTPIPASSLRQGFFPQLNAQVLNKEPATNKKREMSRWRKRDRHHQHTEHLHLQLNTSTDKREKYLQEARMKGVRQPKLSTNLEAMIQTNWKFVETLLKECKAKTKRLLVEKMGQEAVELGHGEATITGVEENTLIAGLCDLLERIWSHGMQNKQGKSALWSHLLSYMEVEQCNGTNKPIDPNLLTPAEYCTLPSTSGPASRRSQLLIGRSASTAGAGASHSLDRDRQRGLAANATLKRHASAAGATTAGGRGGYQRDTSPGLRKPLMRRLYHLADLSSMTLDGSDQNCPQGTQTWPVRRSRQKKNRGLETPVLENLPVSVTFDMKNVQQMSEIKTDVGYARAWVRLSLEKKLLYRHFKELLSNTDLLKSLYKRYAFLRCEDEREQFLYHLLSLNAVDYHCFTNTFTNTSIPYRVLLFPGSKLSGATTTANCWVSLAGQHSETGRQPIIKNAVDFKVTHKNLGILTTLRIGHDNAGMSPKWQLEHLVVRNEVTGHTYRFPCGRWLGRGVDDGALERLLVAEHVPPTTDHSELVEKCRTPPRCRSPSMPRKANEPRIIQDMIGGAVTTLWRHFSKPDRLLERVGSTISLPALVSTPQKKELQIPEIQEMLGDAVNSLVKHFYKPEKERGSMTGLLCGEYGLVFCMEHVFQCGFKSSRLFRGRVFVWDFLEKVQDYFEQLLNDTDHYTIKGDVRRVIDSFIKVMAIISHSSENVGKDGRFQIFICIGIRDHTLQRWLKIISKTPVTMNMYEEKSFLRDAALVQFVVQILDSLKDFNIKLEKSIIKGIEL